MEKKICELKLNEIEAVVGGVAINVTMTAHSLPKPGPVAVKEVTPAAMSASAFV